ncbi:MAG: HIT family protein [Sulfuritalea sp.]|nr:HIT family protein [Sulfuritalea sp.]MDP1983864.1 HIT family protein [Sulfuritalea sp.]
MSGPQQFCGQCFALFPAAATACPRCGTPPGRLSERDYQEKLLVALDHPLADVRMRAILALGLRQQPEVAAALLACALRHPVDIIEGLEIVNSLSHLDHGRPARSALETLVADHPAHAVREAALRANSGEPASPSAACRFCGHAPTILQNGLAFAVFDSTPVNPGHLLLLPHRHVATWFEATADEHSALLDLLEAGREMLEARYRPDGYNIGINVGEAGGQTVMHLHVHLIPRYRGDCANPRGGVRGVIPARQNY